MLNPVHTILVSFSLLFAIVLASSVRCCRSLANHHSVRVHILLAILAVWLVGWTQPAKHEYMTKKGIEIFIYLVIFGLFFESWSFFVVVVVVFLLFHRLLLNVCRLSLCNWIGRECKANKWEWWRKYTKQIVCIWMCTKIKNKDTSHTCTREPEQCKCNETNMYKTIIYKLTLESWAECEYAIK